MWQHIISCAFLLLAGHTVKGSNVQQELHSDYGKSLVRKEQTAEVSAHLHAGGDVTVLTNLESDKKDVEKDPIQCRSLLVLPSTEPYNFSKYTVGKDTHFSQFGQSNWVDQVLHQRSGLFVVESGAWDGEEFSNSLFAETQRQSKCLLIEPNPAAQQTILHKHRKCHLMKGALSTESHYPSTHELIMAGGVGGFTEDIEKSKGGVVKDAIRESRTIEGSHAEFSGKKVNVTCFPLHVIMAELAVPTVDYWSLDTEGAEPGIIENTDFSKIEVGVMTIETVPETRQTIYDTMIKNGFVRIKSLGQDDAYANPSYFSKRSIPFPENACRDKCV